MMETKKPELLYTPEREIAALRATILSCNMRINELEQEMRTTKKERETLYNISKLLDKIFAIQKFQFEHTYCEEYKEYIDSLHVDSDMKNSLWEEFYTFDNFLNDKPND